MKKTIIVALSLVLCIVMLCTGATALSGSSLVDLSEASGNENLDLDNDAGTLKVTTSEDGSQVTISYDVNGETQTYTVPNNVNYTSGGFAATDDLDRALPNSLTTGLYGSNGEHYVGIFYFLWQGEHGDNGVYDLQKIMDTFGDDAKDATAKDEDGNSLYGPVGAMHWFAEPLYGYYYAKDEWVHQKHMELLSNSNIDFLYFDVTNGYTYLDNALKVMEICHNLNEQGYDAPQVVFYTNSSSANVMRELYREIYGKNLYPDTWFMIDGKPTIVGETGVTYTGTDEEGNDIEVDLDEFFTIKANQWPNDPNFKVNGWPWMDFEWPQRIFKDDKGNNSAISVSIAQHNGTVTFSDSSLYGSYLNRGRSFNAKIANNRTMRQYRTAFDKDNSLTNQGLNFQAQWDRAIEADVPYILVTGWNEWVAQRQNGAALRDDEKFVYFVDTASMEFSRDAEMMRGGYFDNYYMQLISNVQRLKGSAPVIVQDSRRPIDVSGEFTQWDDVLITYTDVEGDNADRNAPCFGNGTYTDSTGRNDIVSAKVTSDSKNIYFYVSTAADIVPGDGNSSWMQLFVNTDNDANNGWYGYDYIINYSTKDDTTTTVAKCNTSDGTYGFEVVGEVSYKVEGNQMMVAVPLETLGITGYREIYVEFKWADADENTVFNTMESFYEFGDAAPLGRLNWIYQNYIPGVSEIVYPEDETTTPETETPTEEPTEEPTEAETSTEAPEESGCKSVAGGSAIILISALGCVICAVAARKKKERV